MRVVGFLVCAPLLAACVGDSPVTPQDGSTDSTTDVGQGQDAAADAPLVCDGGSTVMACSNACVDIASSAANCGACAHDCGGGQCVLGVCQPTTVVDALTYPVFDVSATNVYFQKGPTNLTDLVTCPSAGCSLAPTTVATPGWVYQANQGGNVLLMGLNVAFYGELASNPGRVRLFACDPVGGCSTTPITIQNAGLQSFDYDIATSGNDVYFTYYHNLEHANCSAANACTAVENLIAGTTSWPHIGLSADSSGVYFLDPTSHALTKCAPSGTCAPTTLWTGSTATTLNTFAYNNNIYLLDSNASGYAKGTITVCPNTGTCTSPSVLVNIQPYPTILRVDAEGAYWYDSDTKDIKMCPLSGCKPSPRTLVLNQPIVTLMRTDAKFVYWSTDTQILRVAK